MAEPTHAPNNHGEWFISTANPGAALMKLPGLTLKPSVRLVSLPVSTSSGWYLESFGQCQSHAGTTAHLEKALANC